MNWYLEALRKYAVFEGRARRKEYWFFLLFTIIVTLILSFIDEMLGIFDTETGVGLLSGIYSIGVVIPCIAVGIRRLHDTGRSGWWLLITLIPVIGGLVLLVFTVLESQPGDNEYGPNPINDLLRE
jgi:uncharacterized membrane protein YhaH (DUF805 family)